MPQGRIYFLVHTECESDAILAADIAMGGAFTGDDLKSLIDDSVPSPPKPTNFRIDSEEWQHAEGACWEPKALLRESLTSASGWSINVCSATLDGPLKSER